MQRQVATGSSAKHAKALLLLCLPQGWTTFSTTVLALTFVFGDSVKSVFESALFLFLEHPYDVGDMLTMSGNVFAKVKKIDLMYTVSDHP